MKRSVVFALFLLVAISMLVGCEEKEPEPLRICVDIEYVNGDCDIEEKMQYVVSTRAIEYCARAGGEPVRDVEIEYLPRYGTERETALERIRTEIMSGGGPDLFLVACNEKDPTAAEALFTMPEKAMELALFLPLDEYMENNTYLTEWDKMNAAVLAAGRNEEGQQIIPLSYTIPVTVYNAADVEHETSKDITWMDMVESDDTALRTAAKWASNSLITPFIFGGIADYGEEELLFTAEEMLQRFDEKTALQEAEQEKAPLHYTEYLGWEFDLTHGVFDRYEEEYTMIPLYSDDGGVTAEITTYAAINRNTERPEDAYSILDYLASYVSQQSDQLYTYCLLVGDAIGSGTGALRVGSIPMYDGLMCDESRAITPLGERIDWYLTDANYAELCEVREQITNVKFRNELDKEFTQAYRDYYAAVTNGEDAEKVVAESYRRIQQMVRE